MAVRTLRSHFLLAASVALSLAAMSPAFAQQAPKGKADFRYACKIDKIGDATFTVWASQGVCTREAQGKSHVLRCTVSANAIDIPSAIGAERIFRENGKFAGIFNANQRPIPYGGACKLLKADS